MKKPKGLPEWFSLQNYDETKFLTPLEWYENLHKRRMFFVYQNISQKNWQNNLAWRKEDAVKRCKEIHDLIAEKPVIRVNSEKKIYHDKTTVHSLNNSDLVNNYNWLTENAPQVFFEYIELRNQSKGDAFKLSIKDGDLKNYLKDQCSSWENEKALLSINLHASDEHIIEDFKNWLANTRSSLAKKSAKKTFSTADLTEWTDYKILPYLDLKIWSIFTNCHITQVILGNAIFPDELDVDTTERIRRTTKKKAEWLMNHSILDAFGVQIKKERELKLSVKT
jgi:hypothetical protein